MANSVVKVITKVALALTLIAVPMNGVIAAQSNRNGNNSNNSSNNGYDRDGYDRDGYDRSGYSRSGYDRSGYNKSGYNSQGFNRNGYDRDGYDRDGRDRDGYDREGYDRNDCDRWGRPHPRRSVTICHETRRGWNVTLVIPRILLPLYLALGDTIGPCQTSPSR